MAALRPAIAAGTRRAALGTEAARPIGRRAAPLPAPGERLGVAARRISWLLILSLTLMAVAGLGILQVLQTTQVAGVGYELKALERERAALAAEVRMLEARAAERSNLERVYREAVGRLGMVPPEQRLRVTVEAPAPRSAPLPRRYVASVETSEPAAQPEWWDRLLALLPGLD
jgi:hypothetical protein